MKSYLKFLSRNKVYTFISVIGLAVSLMFVILLGDYAWRQFSIDSQHADAERIYMVGNSSDYFMWPQVAQEILELCPDVEQTCRVFSQSGKIKHGEMEVKDRENGIIMLTDPSFFDFFSFRLKEGNPKTALNAPDKCIITETLARKLFAGKNPIGESIRLVGSRNVRMDNQDPYDSTLVYHITGIVEDLDHTVFPNETQVIASMERYPQVMGYEIQANNWAYGPTGTCKILLKMKDRAVTDTTRELIHGHVEKAYPMWGKMNMGDVVTLTPLTDVMFAPQNDGYGLLKGDRQRIWILLSAVLAILFFAVSNYINLTVANTGFRAKEMATRRLFGSTGIQISLKLIAESTLMVAIAFTIGLGLAFAFEQDAVSLFRGKIALASDINFSSVCLCLGFILLVGVVTGILPTWHLSRYQPIDIVRGSFRFHSKMVVSRMFIGVQNVVTVVLLTAALVIYLQLCHVIHAPMGFNTENLYLIDYPSKTDAQTVRARLEQMPFVEQIGCCQGTSFTNNTNTMTSITRGDEVITLFITVLDSTALQLYGLNILKDNGSSSDGYYLTEEALRRFDMKDTDTEIDFGSVKQPLDGVMADIHKGNVLKRVQPMAIQIKENLNEPSFLVKTNGSKEAKAAFAQMLVDLGSSQANTEYYINGLEDNIRETLEDEENTLRIISLFALVAIVISVMGFVGMSLFFIRQRKKDIGIRKIMGSTTHEVTWLMLRTFCMPLLLSFVIAIPLAYWLMGRWLEDFSYRIALSPWIFATTCAFSLVVAILSVGFQILRAARANPVESIKTE